MLSSEKTVFKGFGVLDDVLLEKTIDNIEKI